MFAVFEGPDGSGKTTVAKLVCERLESLGKKVYFTSEPTDSVYGKKLRELLKDPNATAKQMYDLFVADRKQHLEQMKKMSDEGTVVICDRYKYSTYCYQSTHGLDAAQMGENNSLEAPDVTLVLNADPDVLLSRIERRHLSREIYETSEYLKSISSKYNSLPDLFPGEKFVFIDASLPLEEVVSRATEALLVAQLPATELKNPFLKDKKGFIFDLDGTLVDSLMYWRSIDWSVSTADDAYAFLAPHYVSDVMIKGNSANVLAALNASGRKCCIATATRLSVCSPCIKRLGLNKLTRFALCCDDVGAEKTQPDLYLASAKRLGLDVGDCVVIEDMAYAAKTAKAAGFTVIGLYDSHNRQDGVLETIADVYVNSLEEIFG